MSASLTYYPILCYTIRERLVLGELVGWGLQYVAETPAQLKQEFTRFLQAQHKEGHTMDKPELLDPRLLIHKQELQLIRHAGQAWYPESYPVTVPVALVYGQTETGAYKGYIPRLGASFIFQDASQLNPMLERMVFSYYSHLSADETLRHCLVPRPELLLLPFRSPAKLKTAQRPSPAETARNAPVLQELAEPLFPLSSRTAPGKGQLDTAWELESSVEELFGLLQQSQRSILVIGAQGAGKSVVLRHALRKFKELNRRSNPSWNVWRLAPSRILSASKLLGEWQEKLLELLRETERNQSILWIEDFPQLFQSEQKETSMGALLLSFLTDRSIRVVGELSAQEAEQLRGVSPEFFQAFHTLHIPDLSPDSVRLVLERYREHLRQSRKIHITSEALNLSCSLLNRFFPYEKLPGKAMRFLNECAQQLEQERGQQQQASSAEQTLNASFILQAMQERTGMPELFLRPELPLDLQELRQFFEQRIIGQAQVIDELCRIIQVFKAGLNNPDKPIANLLFAGPTGVGKTATAKAVASYFFGQGQKKSPLIRIDMSEYQNPMQVTRLIGHAGTPGELIQKVRERPFSVLLLDEVDKAHPMVFDTLLTLFDEGIFRDQLGRSTSFLNTLIIMTSNQGSQAAPPLGFTSGSKSLENHLGSIRNFFRPEFINRLDAILPFQALKQHDIRQIAIKELQDVMQLTGLRDRQIQLHYSPDVLDYLTAIGFDERYGARPLQRAIDRNIVQPLAAWLLQHPAVQESSILVHLKEGKAVFEWQSALHTR